MPRLLQTSGACALAVALFLTAGSALAQQAPSAQALAAARELVELKGARAMLDPVVRGVVESVKNTFLRTNPQLSRELNEVAALLHRQLEAQRDKPLEEVARVFAERFTLRELQDAITFYKTPLGKKLIELEAPTLEEGLERAQTWASQLADEVLRRMRAEMKRRGHDI